jgi:hypothetical protein
MEIICVAIAYFAVSLVTDHLIYKGNVPSPVYEEVRPLSDNASLCKHFGVL